MPTEDFLQERLSNSGLHVREIREFAYLKHKAGASEGTNPAAIERIGQNQ